MGPSPCSKCTIPICSTTFHLPRGVIGYRTNLPRSTTPFFGGEGCWTRSLSNFGSGSLVTLTGTGGVGKTRAAIEFGHRHLADFDQGVFFVDLAPVSDTGAVVGAVASTLPIVAVGEQSLLDTILDWIGERRVLLLIDNCEHLVAEVGALVEELMARCSNLQILATSREALGVRGERVYRVPSLDADGAAVELFCERARAIDGSFTPEGHLDALVPDLRASRWHPAGHRARRRADAITVGRGAARAPARPVPPASWQRPQHARSAPDPASHGLVVVPVAHR